MALVSQHAVYQVSANPRDHSLKRRIPFTELRRMVANADNAEEVVLEDSDGPHTFSIQESRGQEFQNALKNQYRETMGKEIQEMADPATLVSASSSRQPSNLTGAFTAETYADKQVMQVRRSRHHCRALLTSARLT